MLLILRHRRQNLPRDVVRSHAFALGGEIGNDAMAENRQGDAGDVVHADMIIAVEDRLGLTGENQIQAGARAGTPGEPFLAEIQSFGRFRSGDCHQLLRIRQHMLAHRHSANGVLQRENILRRQHRRWLLLMQTGRHPHDGPLLGSTRIIDLDLKQEPIQLRLGQRIRSFLFDGVLRRQHKERLGQFMIDAALADSSLLHRLEHGRLRLWRRAVDFIRQNDVRENRTFEKLELPFTGGLILVNHLRAGDVGGHQIGRELNALEPQMQRLRQAADHQCFSQSRHTHQQRMAFGEDRDQNLVDHFFLTDDDLGEFGFDGRVSRLQILDGLQISLFQTWFRNRRGNDGSAGGRSRSHEALSENIAADTQANIEYTKTAKRC